MPDHLPDAPCPCGSGKDFASCHGAPHIQARPAPGEGAEGGVLDNPFRRILKPDGTVDQAYVVSRLDHLEGLLRNSRSFLGIRFDRDELTRLLDEHEHLFKRAADQEKFETAFRRFAALALPELVTPDFDAKVKEILGEAIRDPDLSRRDRAAAACGLVLTLPPKGEFPQPHEENPLFDLVLRITYNESLARDEFLAELDEEDLSEMERGARIQEFLREEPALLHELNEGFRKLMSKALESYERGEFSFGMGIDMILHGVRVVRRLTHEFKEEEGDAFTDRQKVSFAERFGRALGDAFAEDIGEDEEREIFARMIGFLEGAREEGAKKVVKGLESALTLMQHNAEVRHRLLLAAYHEAVAGSRLFRSEREEGVAEKIFRQPFDVENYLDYGEWLAAEQQPTRAERVYRAALEFFPDDATVRERLAEVAESLVDKRRRDFLEMQAEWHRGEEEE